VGSGGEDVANNKDLQTAYPSDLTDYQWEAIEDFFSGMRAYKWSKRELVNAVLLYKNWMPMA